MARMHSRRRGRSSSKRPLLKESPKWVPLKAPEIEELVVKLYNQGLPPSQIGMNLRDVHGVPSVKLSTGKTVLEILKEKGVRMDIPEDLRSLIRRAVDLQGHLKEHKKDLHNKRGLELTEAKIRRLTRYYKDAGVLPSDWNYSPEAAELLAK